MKNKKNICIIYTGGTIGMIKSEKGYIPSSVEFKELINSISDLKREEMPNLEIIQFNPLLDSSNMSIHEWNKIGQTISDNYDLYDGFVILHGTDTMSYSASALSFMLENLNKPVIFTGSQIPMCELRSDGYGNLVTAVLMAQSDYIKEVCIYFDGKLLRGCRSTKMSSSHFAAFASPNFEILASAGIEIEYNKNLLKRDVKGEFKFTPFKDVPVGIIKMFPGIQFKLFEKVMTEQLKGVVLETFGAGNIPSNSSGHLIPMIKRAYENGTVIVVCSQCVQGSVTLGAYETSQALNQIGAINGGDMTTEAAMTKLLYLFSKDMDIDEIRRMMNIDLRGELSA
ncbi:MAG: asparaginase [Erysipelotrichaceae bacterium]|nr:asparaginase [Erysipelotrichaceae bacterium]